MKTKFLAAALLVSFISMTLSSCYVSRSRRYERRDYRREHRHRSHGYQRGYYNY